MMKLNKPEPKLWDKPKVTNIRQDYQEEWEERAAILEFDGGLCRLSAESEAEWEICNSRQLPKDMK